MVDANVELLAIDAVSLSLVLRTSAAEVMLTILVVGNLDVVSTGTSTIRRLIGLHTWLTNGF